MQSIEGAIKIFRVVRIRIDPLALPLGELSPQATERILQSRSAYTLSVLASLRHLSQRERQEGVHGKEILGANLSVRAGKIQENRSGFLGRFKGV